MAADLPMHVQNCDLIWLIFNDDTYFSMDYMLMNSYWNGSWEQDFSNEHKASYKYNLLSPIQWWTGLKMILIISH